MPKATAAAMQGKANIRFSELFADTLRTHGYSWAWQFYCLQGGMAEWEFSFWLKTAG